MDRTMPFESSTQMPAIRWVYGQGDMMEEIEKTNLEAHVALCAERYDQLASALRELKREVLYMRRLMLMIAVVVAAGLGEKILNLVGVF
jgi:hypothetical protein